MHARATKARYATVVSESLKVQPRRAVLQPKKQFLKRASTDSRKLREK